MTRKFILALIFLFASVSAFIGKHGKIPATSYSSTATCGGEEDCGTEVSITDYLLAGNATGAKQAVQVFDIFQGKFLLFWYRCRLHNKLAIYCCGKGVDSYAGFATVDISTKNNLFFWFVPAMDKNLSAPLLIWLQVRCF
jgi:hypothetical protein